MLIIDTPELNFSDDRKEGISAMLRVRNGEDFLEVSILSVLQQVDEIVCVFNNSQDNTEKILCKLEEQYPDKIFVYKYVPIVYPPNTENYKKTPEDNVHSLSYYYNFALSKTRYSHIFKLDDDHIFFPNILRIIKEDVTSDNCIGLVGLNLIDFNENLFVNETEKFTDSTDMILFKYNNKCRFEKDERYEIFTGHADINKVAISNFHLKRCKKDRGINNYDINTNLDSRYLNITTGWFNTLTNENLKLYESAFNDKLPHPYSLGFKYINHSNKEYNYELFNQLESKLSNRMTNI